jgi:hypothetical protein
MIREAAGDVTKKRRKKSKSLPGPVKSLESGTMEKIGE